MSDKNPKPGEDSLFDSLVRLTGQVAGGTLEMARNTAAMSAMFGETWLRNALVNSMEPERLEAMADAGKFLRDARETAGLSLRELAESLGVSEESLLEDVESGESIMPLELMLRAASLLARHDPIPFLIKFMRTYNPSLEKTLESWGVLALPIQYERERRFINLYRQHDALRGFSDDEFERFIEYMESSGKLVLDVMAKEKAANAPRKRSSARKGGAAAKKAAPKRKTAPKKRGSASPKAPARKAKTRRKTSAPTEE